MSREPMTSARALQLLAEARADLEIARRGPAKGHDRRPAPAPAPAAAPRRRQCALCGHELRRDDWLIAGELLAWHAECWHVQHHGDLLDLLRATG